MYTRFNLVHGAIILLVLAGCSNSGTPSVQAVIDTLNGYSENHDGIYEFSGIKKLDGQLLQEGSTYIMDYEATIVANDCFTLGMHGYSDFVRFDGSADKKKSEEVCARPKNGKGFSKYLSNFVVFRDGYRKQFQAQARFTKKESGWQIQDMRLHQNLFRE